MIEMIAETADEMVADVIAAGWPGQVEFDVVAPTWRWIEPESGSIPWDPPLNDLVDAMEAGARSIRIQTEGDWRPDHHHILDQVTVADAYGFRVAYLPIFNDWWTGDAYDRAHWRNIINVYRDWTGTHANPHIFFSLNDRQFPVKTVVAAR